MSVIRWRRRPQGCLRLSACWRPTVVKLHSSVSYTFTAFDTVDHDIFVSSSKACVIHLVSVTKFCRGSEVSSLNARRWSTYTLRSTIACTWPNPYAANVLVIAARHGVGRPVLIHTPMILSCTFILTVRRRLHVWRVNGVMHQRNWPLDVDQQTETEH